MAHDNSSILSYLADKQRFTNGTEDIATEVLGYILSKSAAARNALSDTLFIGGANVGQLSNVNTQVTGDEGARPDLVGRDKHGSERVLIEVKFWAGLTKNQPNTYLERLPNGGKPAVLLFVAPETRLETLWPEVLRSAEGKFNLSEDTGSQGIKSATVDGSERRLLLTSWRTLLGSMSSRASVDGDSSAEQDILQLNALCEQQDSTAFLPLNPGEFGPSFPRRMPHLLNLVQQAIEDKRLDRFTTKRFPWASSTSSHGRFLWFKDVPVWLGVQFTFWARYRETPVWLILRDTSFDGAATIEEIRRRAKPFLDRNPPEAIETGSDILIPIYLSAGTEYDGVLGDMVERLGEIASLITAKRRGRLPKSP